MEYNLFLEYYEAAIALEAQRTLVDLSVVSFPNLSKNDRTKLHKEFFNKAYGLLEASQVKPAIKLKDFVLGMSGAKANG